MNTIQQDFISSWRSMKNYYDDLYTMRMFLGNHLANRVIGLIDAMQQEGYDSHLRARQATHYFILCRSQASELYGDHHYLCFSPECWEDQESHHTRPHERLKVTYRAGETLIQEIEQEAIQLTQGIRQLLHQLIEQPII